MVRGMIDIKHDALFLARHILDTSEGSVKRIESEHQKAIACAERLVTALGTKEEFYNLLTEKAANLLGVQGEPLLSAMNEYCKHFDNLAMQPRGKPFEKYASEEFAVPKEEREIA